MEVIQNLRINSKSIKTQGISETWGTVLCKGKKVYKGQKRKKDLDALL